MNRLGKTIQTGTAFDGQMSRKRKSVLQTDRTSSRRLLLDARIVLIVRLGLRTVFPRNVIRGKLQRHEQTANVNRVNAVTKTTVTRPKPSNNDCRATNS